MTKESLFEAKMINVKIRRDEEGYIYGYSVEGHAENGNEVDEAVACNSVSVVTQFPLIGAQRQLKLNAEIEQIVAREQVLRDEIAKIIAEIEVG
jgi:uncharacterized protein YsxB (DUF464 family)